MTAWLREAAVPLVGLAGATLYVVGIDGAHASARRFPLLVVALLVVLAVVLLARTRAALVSGGAAEEARDGERALKLRRAAFVALALAYYPAFSNLGFDIANTLFLLAALPLAGLGAGRAVAVRAGYVVGVTALLVVVFRLMATALDLNLPPGLLSF